MAKIHWLIILIFVTIVVINIFSIGAQKVQKNRLLWGVLGALSFWIPILVLFPIAESMIVSSAREIGRDSISGLILSYSAITIAVGVFVSIMVYKKILVKVPTIVDNGFIFCSECGTQCSDNTAFCNKCGCKLSGA